MHTPHRILIVDDQSINIVILEEILGETYVLATAESGEEALALAPSFQPALILLDIMMPGLDGYETCRRIRALPTLHHTKIIMVSAKDQLAERLQGYAAGADDYLIKPFDAEELLAKVRVYLRLKSAEELVQLKSDLLTLLQHEVRTPLNGIITPAALLMAETTLDETERREFLEMVHHSAVRLATLFDKVLTLSAMKSGVWDFQFTASDLCIVVRHAITAVSAQATTSHVHIEPQLPDSALALLDHGQMQGAVIALLENAIRFSSPQARVEVLVRCDDGQLCLQVTYQGPGIQAGLLPHILEGLVPADVTHYTAGHGLSLAIVQQIVQAHQGTIRVESAQDVGTRCIVQLPRLGSADRCHEALRLAMVT